MTDVTQTPVVAGQPTIVTFDIAINSGQTFPVKFIVPPVANAGSSSGTGISSDQINSITNSFLPLASKASSVTLLGQTLNINYSAVNVAGSLSLTNAISDIPGKTSTAAATTAWVDANYTPLASYNTLSTQVTSLSKTVSSSGGGSGSQYIVADPTADNIGAGFNLSFGSKVSESVAIGVGVSAGGSYSVAIGQSATTTPDCGVAVGQGTSAGNNGTSVGISATSPGACGTALGCAATASGDHSFSAGSYCTAVADYSTALGYYASVPTGNNSISLGSWSTTTESNVVSVGYGPNQPSQDEFAPSTVQYRRITNVADGTNPHDAVTVEQLQSSSGAPVGTIIAYGFSDVPAGYLQLNGASFSQTAYPALYAKLNSTTLPDARGLFLRGLDNTGIIDNATNRQLLSFEEGTYVVGKQDGSISGIHNLGSATWAAGNQTFNADIPNNRSANISTGWALNGSETAGDPTKNPGFLGVSRPKNLAVNYLIKAQ